MLVAVKDGKKTAENEKFIGEGVHQCAEVAHLIVLAGKIAVEKVGQRGEYREDVGSQTDAEDTGFILKEGIIRQCRQYDEDDHRDYPAYGQYVRNVFHIYHFFFFPLYTVEIRSLLSISQISTLILSPVFILERAVSM